MRTFSSAKDPTARTRRLGAGKPDAPGPGGPPAGEGTERLPRPDDETVVLGGSERPPPRVLDRYLLERRLGSGGFGAVWLAFDEKLRREVAIKVIPRDDDAVGDRATREARAAARLNHPGIVALYELLGDHEAIYLVSELVAGRTLAELTAAEALADRDVARIGAALCDALAHAHERGVIHRDVKPQNVMVVAEPAAGAGFAKLTDFGVAQLVGGDESTGAGGVVGTPAYMAPEQAEGERASAHSDVYSLALTLYEAFAGENPVRGRTPAETMRRIGTWLPALGSRRRDLPPGLCDAIDAGLAPLPERRPGIAELRAAIAAAEPTLSDSGGLVEDETLERVGLPRKTRRRVAGVPIPGTRVIPPAEPHVVAGERPARLPEAIMRAAAGAAAAIVFVTAAELLGPAMPIGAPVAAAAVAVAVALLPRIGWIASAIALCGWLAAPEADRLGTALVLAALLAPVPLLLPRAGRLWSVPALAPALGALGVAPLYLALAGLAATFWRRAGLGAAGFVWLAGAEILSGESLLFGTADGTLARAAWETSLTGAASDAVHPALAGPALAPVVVWAAFAAVLPLLVRGRALALDVLGAVLWAAGLVAAHGALAAVLTASVELDEARGALAGALLGGVVAVACAAFLPPAPRGRADALGGDGLA